MSFNYQQYNTHYLLNARDDGEPINDAVTYGVRIVEADVAEGETYWKVIGVHHLQPRENFSNHHVYLEALDEQGNRLANPPVFVGWTWEGRRPEERAAPVPLDKPPTEPGANISIYFGQIVSVWVQGTGPDGQAKSDRVENLHTAHPDEPLPDGSLLNTLGHHSFYVVFQRTKKADELEGTISGRVERGAGQTVRLYRNNQPVAEEELIDEVTFSFNDLSFGIYSLEVVGQNIGQSNIRLDAAHSSATINLALPLPTRSVISGRVENGQGRMLLLVTQGNIISRLPLPPSGEYRFENLGAGLYSVIVFETNTRQDNIQVNGANSQEVNLVVTAGEPEPGSKLIKHYLLLGPPNTPGRRIILLLASDYILNFSITVGSSLAEARQAQQVTVIGSGFNEADLQVLRDAGSQVELIGEDIFTLESLLAERVRTGRAFGE